MKALKAIPSVLLMLTLQLLSVTSFAQGAAGSPGAGPISIPVGGDAGAKKDGHWLQANANHRAIFCGHQGHEEASAAYSAAMSQALDEERARGRGAVQSITAWRAQFCVGDAASTNNLKTTGAKQ